MADTVINNPILSVCATTAERVKELAIKNGQLIFVQDKHRIALDFNGKRVFYNQITELESEESRKAILAPISGMYYFVIGTAILWTYNNGWVQITSRPEEIVFIGTEMPELGSETTLYVDKKEKHIKVWDAGSGKYIIVADTTEEISEEFIDSLFA